VANSEKRENRRGPLESWKFAWFAPKTLETARFSLVSLVSLVWR
jgi:hypothetical protein